MPVLVLYVGFVLLTWLADPLLNLLLMLRPEGRRLLSSEDRDGAVLVGGSLALALALAAAGAAAGWSGGLLAAIGFATISITLSGAYQVATGADAARCSRSPPV